MSPCSSKRTFFDRPLDQADSCSIDTMSMRDRVGTLPRAVWLLGLFVGCAPRAARPICPAGGGLPWVRIESAHFEVFTDLNAADADAAARELEGAFAALSLAFEGARVPTERTEVVVFRAEEESPALVPGTRNGALS